MASLAFKVGDRVECWNKDEGFLDSYYEADVQSISGKRCLIKYVELLTDDGERLIENLPLEQLRPLPPRVDSLEGDPQFQPGSSIEAHHQDGWWKGAVATRVDPEHYLCYFLSNGIEQLQFHYSELRTRQDWVNGKWIVKGAKGSQPEPPAAPQLELPSPCTPESPSPLHQTQGKETPQAESFHTEGFVLDDEDDIDIENSWEGPAFRIDAQDMGTAQPPVDEEGTVSDLGRSSSEGAVEQEPLVQPRRESWDGRKGLKSARVKFVLAGQKKRKGELGKQEGSPSSKKPRKAEPCGKKRNEIGEKSVVEKRVAENGASRELKRGNVETFKAVTEGSNRGAFAFSADATQRGPSRVDQSGGAILADKVRGGQSESHQSGGAKKTAGFGSSPFGKSTVMRWGTKQRSMSDVMRRSSTHVDPRGSVSSYERECEIDEERRRAHRKAHARHLAARKACHVAPQLDGGLFSEQSWDVAADVAAHVASDVASDAAADYPLASDVAAYHWEDESTPCRDSREARRVSFREPIHETIPGEGSEVPGASDWTPGEEERPWLAIEPATGAYRTGQFSSEAPSERFSFRGAYGNILEALLRKEMLDYRREFLLAELRSELHISDRCHAKQYHRAMERISSLPAV